MRNLSRALNIGVTIASAFLLHPDLQFSIGAQARQGGPVRVASQLVDGYLPAPARRAGEGLGPYTTLVIRGAMLIDGTGAPPTGPVDIVVSGNRIQSVRNAGTPVIRANIAPCVASATTRLLEHQMNGTPMRYGLALAATTHFSMPVR